MSSSEHNSQDSPVDAHLASRMASLNASAIVFNDIRKTSELELAALPPAAPAKSSCRAAWQSSASDLDFGRRP